MGGLSELSRRVGKLMQLSARYGIAPEEGREKKKTVPGVSDTNANVAMIAVINESIRPAFRRSFTAGSGELIDGVSTSMSKLVRGDASAEAAMQDIASVGARLIVDQIRSSPGWAKPNSPEWERVKGNRHPLIATGQEVESISGSVGRGDDEISKEVVGGG